MKPSNRCEIVDFAWCKKVSNEELATIEEAFSTNPKAQKKFIQSTSVPDPAVSSIWLNISEEKAKDLTLILQHLPERFTYDQFLESIADYRDCITKPPATHILYLLTYLWEVDKNHDILYFDPYIAKL